MRSRTSSWFGSARCGHSAGSDEPLTEALAGAYSEADEGAAGEVQVIFLELRLRRTHICAELVCSLPQLRRLARFARFDRICRQNGATCGKSRSDFEVRIDPIPEPARSFPLVNVQCLSRGHRRLVVAAMRPVKKGRIGVGQKQDVRAAQPPARLQR